MTAGFITSLSEFVSTEADQVIGQLTQSLTRQGFDQLRLKQVPAWEQQFSILQTACRGLLLRDVDAGDWHILLEYAIPRRQKRPDVVVLARDLVFVIEFKVGSQQHDSASKWQAESYARDLHDFHAESAGRVIIPILVSTEADEHQQRNRSTDHSVWQVQCHNSKTLASGLYDIFVRVHDAQTASIDPLRWDQSAYRPSLTIIEAAESLYSHNDVREISHRYADNLGKTTQRLVDAVREAQSSRRRVICFVTGVPGAGKTLAGLNAVHNPELREDGRPAGVFLSGNSPLVRIVRAAVARNVHKKLGITKGEASRRVQTFVQNIHSFLDHHRKHSEIFPAEQVIVFDEAQRAWCHVKDIETGSKLVEISEPATLLEIMTRCDEWCVIIALVGGGQEIHTGEGGLREWGNAISCSPVNWRVMTLSEALSGGHSVAGERLFEREVPSHVELIEDDSLHLNVSVRSQRAQRIAEWANHVLAGNFKRACDVARRFHSFPIVLTRDLDCARTWLRERSANDRRCGLVATSGALRHRTYGLEVSSGFRHGFPYEEWFLAPADDIRSSTKLEVAATEFEIQGLELDWVGLCWAGDLTFDATAQDWQYRRIVGSRWQYVRKVRAQEFLRNKYRVLLTRAREGMVIWVPPGRPTDPTLEPEPFDATADYILSTGVVSLSSSE